MAMPSGIILMVVWLLTVATFDSEKVSLTHPKDEGSRRKQESLFSQQYIQKQTILNSLSANYLSLENIGLTWRWNA
jgi:hypothetical protein